MKTDLWYAEVSEKEPSEASSVPGWMTILGHPHPETLEWWLAQIMPVISAFQDMSVQADCRYRFRHSVTGEELPFELFYND